MRFDEIGRIMQISGSLPKALDEKAAWLRFKDFRFILMKTISDHALIYYNGEQDNTSGIVISVLIPKKQMKSLNIAEPIEWDIPSQYGWGYGTTSSKSGWKKKLYPPFDGSRTKAITKGEPILFHRYFEGHTKSSFIELNQKISQILEIFWCAERNAYCKFDENGDYDEVVKLKVELDNSICTIKKSDLDFYAYLTDARLVRFFDFIRRIDNDRPHVSSENKKVLKVRDEKDSIYADINLMLSENGEVEWSWIRGFQIVGSSKTPQRLKKRLVTPYLKNDKFASYIVQDFKHRVVTECSCSPEKTDSYFVETGKPFQTTPAFFRPDVLLKYKQDPDKYTLDGRSIYCRGAWHLKRYDINSAGQVNALLCDLATLPYNEQLYWKSFNEAPKGTISRKSYQCDFLGQVPDEHDSLLELRYLLEGEFPMANQKGISVPIWELRGEHARRRLSRLNHIETSSKKEWEDQILELAKILVDGLNKKSINSLAKQLNCHDPKLGSIKQLEACLVKKEVEIEVINTIVSPLYRLYKTRSATVAHMDIDIPSSNLAEDYDKMICDCLSSFKILSSLIRDGLLDY